MDHACGKLNLAWVMLGSSSRGKRPVARIRANGTYLADQSHSDEGALGGRGWSSADDAAAAADDDDDDDDESVVEDEDEEVEEDEAALSSIPFGIDDDDDDDGDDADEEGKGEGNDKDVVEVVDEENAKSDASFRPPCTPCCCASCCFFVENCGKKSMAARTGAKSSGKASV